MIIDELIELEILSKKAQKDRLLDEVFKKLKSGDILSFLLLAIYGYFAQTEHEIISQRTK